MTNKPKVYLTSNVFSSEHIGSNKMISKNICVKIKYLWEELTHISKLNCFDGRFPTGEKIQRDIDKFNPNILAVALMPAGLAFGNQTTLKQNIPSY